MPLKPCLDCGALSPGPRCPAHARAKANAYQQTKRAARPHLHSEDVRRARAVAEHRAQFGDVCPGYQRDPHEAIPTNPLTADHLTAVARGGAESGTLTILCRSCNSRKGHRG